MGIKEAQYYLASLDLESEAFKYIRKISDDKMLVLLNKKLLNSLKCPLSKELLINPIVAADGHTYESEHFEKYLQGQKTITSRTVTSPINRFLNLKTTNTVKNRVIESIVEMFQKFNEDKQETPPKKKIKLESNERIREITDCLNCSLTQELIEDPIIVEEGHSYGSKQMLRLVDHNGIDHPLKSPLTNKKLDIIHLEDSQKRIYFWQNHLLGELSDYCRDTQKKLSFSTWCKEAANQGNADAQYNLGMMHLTGQEIDKSVDSAAKYFYEAAIQGHKKAKAKLETLEQKGNANAQYNLGMAYEFGQNVPDPIAMQYYGKAAEQSHEAAQIKTGEFHYKLGYNYEFGKNNFRIDKNAAIEQYNRAADLGYYPALIKHGEILLNDTANQFKCGEFTEPPIIRAAVFRFYQASKEDFKGSLEKLKIITKNSPVLRKYIIDTLKKNFIVEEDEEILTNILYFLKEFTIESTDFNLLEFLKEIEAKPNRNACTLSQFELGNIYHEKAKQLQDIDHKKRAYEEVNKYFLYAANYYQKAANQGHLESQYNLVSMYKTEKNSRRNSIF